MRAFIGVTALVLVLVTACSGQGSEPPGATNDSTAVGTRVNSQSAGAASDVPRDEDRSVTWRTHATLTLPYNQIDHLQVRGSLVTFDYPADGSPHANAVALWDTETGKLKTLARTSYPGGVIDWVEFDGQNVVFVDLSHVGTLGSGVPVRWRIRKVNIEGEAPQVLAESPVGGTQVAPLPTEGGSGFVWSIWQDQKDPFRGRKVVIWQPGRRPQVILQRIMVPDLIGLTDRGLLYPDSMGQWPSGKYRIDLFLWPHGASEPTRLTDSGLVIDVETDGRDQVIWTESHRELRQGPGRASPYLTYTADLDDFQPRELQRGYSAGNSTIGGGWAAWWTENSKVVVRATGPEAGEAVQVRSGRAHIPARLDADGDLLVFAQHRRGSLRIMAVKVSVPR